MEMCKNVFDMREATDGDTSNAIAIGILALVEVCFLVHCRREGGGA